MKHDDEQEQQEGDDSEHSDPTRCARMRRQLRHACSVAPMNARVKFGTGLFLVGSTTANRLVASPWSSSAPAPRS
jgi:hypothetical protein